eukprot:m.69483 g.69483  ORF g.69483 m.69483 type:complete len:344 (+) comp9968_c0_seq2:505-1536(+)
MAGPAAVAKVPVDTGVEYVGEWEYLPLVNSTPSADEGVEATKEARYRRDGCRFIKDVAQKLNLHMNVYNTGAVFYHRFYLKHSFKKYPRFYMAAACLFVAGKVEEQPKKLRDLLPCVYQLYPRKSQPTGPNGESVVQPFGQKMMTEMKMQILANERALLQTLDFDLVLKHPPQYLFQFAKGLQLESGEKIPNQLVQLAYRYVSDSFQTLTCLEYRPMVLAVALLHLATTMLKLTVVVQPTAEVFNPDSAGGVTKWWELFVPGSSAQMKDIHQKTLIYYEQIGESLQSTAQPALQALASTTQPSASPGVPAASAELAARDPKRSKSASKMPSGQSRSRQRTGPY